MIPHTRRIPRFNFFILPITIFITLAVLWLHLKSQREIFDCCFTGNTVERQNKVVKGFTGCNTSFPTYKLKKARGYVMLYNYVKASKFFGCESSVTYVTHGDFTFLSSLVKMVKLWRRPVSIALYAPGSDFWPTVYSIQYLRSCKKGVKEFVTFHVYFNEKYQPAFIPNSKHVEKEAMNCSSKPPYQTFDKEQLFTFINNISYPSYIGRTVALSAAKTHFVLVVNVELSLSLNIIPKILKVNAGCINKFETYQTYAFALPVFTLESAVEHGSKSDLQETINEGFSVTPLHNYFCSICSTTYDYVMWLNDINYDGLHGFEDTKKIPKLSVILIRSKNQSFITPKLRWKVKSNKILSRNATCNANSSFFILDNAVLMYKAGFKTFQLETYAELQQWQVFIRLRPKDAYYSTQFFQDLRKDFETSEIADPFV